ncbi:hypothetical protein C0993_004991 [Termitomyces sp. T159_Od127]|nr:hypothetical protein C0993_004991 [Termitomyces sp. T159_Od127]
MAPVNFKLTEPDGLTRRIVFAGKPSWKTFAERVELLFGIPFEKVSVSYVDADNDKVTLSSQEELDDFYATSYTDGQAIRFTVQNLPIARLQRTLSRKQSRNTIGMGAFDIEDDWQTLPMPPISELQGLFLPNIPTEGQTHGFVETLDSDRDTAKDEGIIHHESFPSSPSSSSYILPVGSLDKGKQKAVFDDDVSSTRSVLGEDAPPKPPVHVYDFQTPKASDGALDYLCEPAESTPKVDPQMPNTAAGQAEEANTAAAGNSKSDPSERPLPNFSGTNTNASTSFFNDLTSFFTTFSDVIAAHPELSEGLRNILRNTLNGTYWHVHRDDLSQAVHDITRETGVAAEALRKEAEEAARRRVADALGGVFRSLSDTLQSANTNVPHSTSPQSTSGQEPVKLVPVEEVPSRPSAPDVTEFNPRMRQGPGHWRHQVHRGSPLPCPPPFIPFHNPYPNFHVPPPPPFDGSFRSFSNWPPPPPPQFSGHYPPGPSSPAGPYFTPPPPTPHMETSVPNKPTPQELRAQVDEAKARYRAEKEKYRLDREERRKGREMRDQTVAAELNTPASPSPFVRPTTPVIAVQGRNNQPSYEVVSRRNTHLGHGSSTRRQGYGFEHSDLRTRTINRIAKRLADMGFSESTHPDLIRKINVQIPIGGAVRHDSEDDIVTTLLEDLLATSPRTPAASGSGAREIPGAWH